tara:strand:+ start:55 stop:228 length:174 start_codon:yes stop_codon:yes gene_type:complete
MSNIRIVERDADGKVSARRPNTHTRNRDAKQHTQKPTRPNYSNAQKRTAAKQNKTRM